MRYNPDDAKPPLLPDDWYDAEIVNAVEKQSKAGNDMLQVTFKVFAGSAFRLIDDYFVNNNQSMLSRLKKLCAVVGHNFAAGEVGPSNLMGKSLKVMVKTRKDETGKYDDQNVVAGYRSLTDEVQPQPAEAGQNGGTVGQGDDIPF